MLVQKDFINKLKDFNLNSYEAKLWVGLLSRGISTAGELSDIANVPRSRCYDVLESLEKKGFIITKIGKPIKYIAVPPTEVVERVKKKIKEDASKDVERLESVKDSKIMEELSTLHDQGVEMVDVSELSASVKGRDALYEHLEMMIKGAETSVTIITTSSELIRKLDILKETFTKASKRGVKIRIAAPVSKETKKIVDEMKSVAEIRNVENINARFVIVDSKELVFMIMDDKEVHPSYDVGIWINTPFFASAMEQLFELAFKELKKIN